MSDELLEKGVRLVMDEMTHVLFNREEYTPVMLSVWDYTDGDYMFGATIRGKNGKNEMVEIYLCYVFTERGIMRKL